MGSDRYGAGNESRSTSFDVLICYLKINLEQF